eukprot:811748-Alexandrium_andersonii.AAC.1
MPRLLGRILLAPPDIQRAARPLAVPWLLGRGLSGRGRSLVNRWRGRPCLMRTPGRYLRPPPATCRSEIRGERAR